METINIHEATTQLSRLVEQAAKGKPFIIAKAGKPMVEVVPLDAPEAVAERRFGGLEGKIDVPDDVDTMFEEDIERMFYGDE